MNETINVMLTRRSCKSYSAKQVDETALQTILQAGLYAPSGMGKQTAIFVVVQDPEEISYLSKLNAAVMGVDSDPFYGAPTVIVVLADSTSYTCVEDGSLAMGNLLNAAHSLGVDSCWIHRARQVFDSNEGKALLKKWGVEGPYIGIGHCILGYRDENLKEAAVRKENRIYRP